MIHLKIENNVLTIHDIGRLIYYFPKVSKLNVNHPKTQIGMILEINRHGVIAIFGNNKMYINLTKCKFVNTKSLMETNSNKTENSNKLEVNMLFENILNSKLQSTNIHGDVDIQQTLMNMLFYNIPYNQEVNVIKDRLTQLFTTSVNSEIKVKVRIEQFNNEEEDDEAVIETEPDI